MSEEKKNSDPASEETKSLPKGQENDAPAADVKKPDEKADKSVKEEKKPEKESSGKKAAPSADKEKKETAGPEKTEEKKQEKKEEKKEKTASKISFEAPQVSRKTVVIVASVVLLLFLGFFVALSGLFRVKNIEINGNYAVSDERIIELAGIEPGDFIFRFDWLPTVARIKAQEPYISDISIHSVFPSGIRIEVEERAKIAYIRLPDGYAAVDEEGTVLELSADYTERVHPVICGVYTDHAVLGHKLEIENYRDYQKMIIVLGSVLAADRNNTSADDEYSFFENLQEVRIIPSGMMFLTIKLPGENTVQVKLNDINTITDQMNWLVHVVEEGKLDDLSDGVLDMTGEEPIFRPYD